MNLIILGPQGCGKGTQAKLLSEKYHLKNISTGDLLREEVEKNSHLGQEISSILNRGDLVPFIAVKSVLKQAILSAPQGFILDGTPRKLDQAQYLDEMFNELNIFIDRVIFLDIPDDVARERLAKRAITENRKDDTPEAINNRLAIYHTQTQPVIDHYQKLGKLLTINGTPDISTIFNDIVSQLSI